MYLLINETQYTVTRRIVSGDTIKYIGVTPEPTDVSGKIKMYRNDGFFMSEDDADNYARKVYSGTVLNITNKPAPNTDPFAPPSESSTAQVVTAVVG